MCLLACLNRLIVTVELKLTHINLNALRLEIQFWLTVCCSFISITDKEIKHFSCVWTAMKNLLLHCRELVTDDIINQLLTPLACAVTLLTKSVPGFDPSHFHGLNKCAHTLCSDFVPHAHTTNTESPVDELKLDLKIHPQIWCWSLSSYPHCDGKPGEVSSLKIFLQLHSPFSVGLLCLCYAFSLFKQWHSAGIKDVLCLR